MSDPKGPGPSAKLWGGRFEQKTDSVVERFTASIHFDRALARFDVRGSIAHARMLHHVDLIGADDERALVEGLEQIGREIETGAFSFDPALEDIHMNIESRLRDLVGPDTAGRLHTGRSRNDQIATDLAMYLRETTAAAERGILELRRALTDRAREHLDSVLPGYTHLQRAQPVRLAHHWLAFVEMLGRDAARFRDLRERITQCPLGSGAIAGSALPLDREHTAAALGFVEPTANSMDSVASRDLALEFLSAGAICMVHLSRLSEELVIWASAEFGFIELSDAYSTGSSLMPQKKNPDVPEIVRGKTGRVIGNLVALLTVMKGLPLTYNRDMQEDKEPVFDTASTLCDALEVTTGAIATLRVNVDAMAEAAGDAMLLATDLAEALVRVGVPFREAHEAVGRAVAHCVRNELDLRSLSADDLRGFHSAFDAPAAELASLDAALEGRSGIGGTARSTVVAALSAAEADNARHISELDRSDLYPHDDGANPR
ncbi:MAG: argininosuccinate lyase [Myxococcota bacterium]